MSSFLAWLQTTSIATTMGESALLTGFVSGIHLLGLTVIVGGAFVSGLRLLGVILPARPVADVTAAVGRGMMLGLAVSVASGLLLFAPRALSAASNSVFQTKMLLLLTAVVFQVAVHGRVTRRRDAGPRVQKFTGACGLALWFGVAVAGCAYILFE